MVTNCLPSMYSKLQLPKIVAEQNKQIRRPKSKNIQRQRIYSTTINVTRSSNTLWIGELEFRFLHVIGTLGDNCYPSDILHHMNVEGISCKQVASHLQKHRKRLLQLQSIQTENTSTNQTEEVDQKETINKETNDQTKKEENESSSLDNQTPFYEGNQDKSTPKQGVIQTGDMSMSSSVCGVKSSSHQTRFVPAYSSETQHGGSNT